MSELGMTDSADVYPCIGHSGDSEPKFGTKYTIACRWVDGDAEGTLQGGSSFSAQIGVYDEVIPLESVVTKGDGLLHQVKSRKSAKSVLGDTTRYEYQTARYKGAFPDEGGTGTGG